MIRHIHHPSCPAGHTAGARCICGVAARRRNPDRIVEAVAFAAMLAGMVSVPIYLMWRY